MPNTPLLDFESIDIDHVHEAPEGIRKLLHQRGTFEMLDAIVHHDSETGFAVGRKEIRGDDWWAPDHIPGRPLFPGALMIEAGAQVCSYSFLQRFGPDERPFVGFGGVDAVRFRDTVEPDCTMIFAAQPTRVRSRMFIYDVQGFVDRKLVFEGVIRGVIL